MRFEQKIEGNEGISNRTSRRKGIAQEEGIACAKTLRWERVWHIQGDSKEASMAGIECTRRRVVREKVERSWLPDHVDF